MLVELAESRRSLHSSHKVVRCDMVLTMPGLRAGRAPRKQVVSTGRFALSGECVCRDLVADVLHVVSVFLTEHGPTLENVPGAVRYHVRMRVHDVLRSYRAQRGAQVKPKQVRKNKFGRALPDEEHRAVLGHLADEAGYSAPLPGHGYLLRRLAERCVAEFGNTVPYYVERLPEIIKKVKQVCSDGSRVNVGTPDTPEYVSWYEAYIERPLGRRPDTMTAPISDDNASPWGADQVPDPTATCAFDAVEGLSPDSDEAVLTLVVRQVAAAPPTTRVAILRDAVRGLAVAGALSPLRADALLSSPTRVADVLFRVDEVIAASRIRRR
ncbi:hypothetical protein ACTG9Q_13320 [Actinokineospora sp. 24-640]